MRRNGVIVMGLFSKKTEIAVPKIETDKYDLILRCSICSGEQILCMQDRKDGSLHELMLVRSFDDLKRVCDANNIDPASVKKIY